MVHYAIHQPVKSWSTFWRGIVLPSWVVTWTAWQGAAAGPGGHWAFLPVEKVNAPEVVKRGWVRNPIDRFILAKLEREGIEPAPPASREQFIRRVSYGLTGLPPTPDEVAQFVRDSLPGAEERLIDRLLASPRYGERWGRHWLDLARYAESDGFEHDALRPHAWRYRDYVIESFNADKPYDRFIREQVAGDELWPEDPAALVATGFHLLGPDMVDSSDQVQRRLNTLNDATDTMASVFLGLTMGCARCHDHKFEPFTQRDYYSLQAFYTPALFERDRVVPTPEEQRAHEREAKAYEARTEPLRRELEALEQGHVTPEDPRPTKQETLLVRMSAEEKERWTQLREALDQMEKPSPLPRAMTLGNTNGSPPDTHVLVRGDYLNPAERVTPGYPAVLAVLDRSDGQVERVQGASTRSIRTDLAEWLVAEDNPLTARVMVNRIWQHHFGRGLVETPSDFGTRGAPPTHPELLDWLATEFRERGWSLKAMHRLILTSATYAQSSLARPESLERDPANRWFSRQNRVRLEGEAIRDSLLAVSGRLNVAMGGPSVMPPVPADISKGSQRWNTSALEEDHLRRSVYILARRNLRFPFLEVFDAPDSNLSCPERGRSTTAPQSLTLLNSAEVMEAARATGDQLIQQARTIDEGVSLAFRLTLCREPSMAERSLAGQFLGGLGQGTGGWERSPAEAGESAWAELCRALFNVNGFVYVD